MGAGKHRGLDPGLDHDRRSGPGRGLGMVIFRGFDRVWDLGRRHAVARPAASGLLGRLVGVGKHRRMDRRCTFEPSLGLVRGLSRGIGRGGGDAMARSWAAVFLGHLVVVGEFCGLGRRAGHQRSGLPGVPGTVLRGRFWGRDRGDNRDCAGMAAATSCSAGR